MPHQVRRKPQRRAGSARGRARSRRAGRPAMEQAYARIEGEAVLRHETRSGMLHLLAREPGLSLQEIGARVRLARGPTQWHLDKLERNGYVARLRHGGESLYFPRGTSPHQAKAVAVLREPSRRALLKLVARKPGVRPSEVARALGLQPPTIRHHARELLDLGLLMQQDTPTAVLYLPTSQGLHLLEKLEGPAPSA